MRIFISGMLCMVLSLALTGQSFFHPISESQVPTDVKAAGQEIIPLLYHNYKADHEALFTYLQKELPLETMGAKVSLEFPITSTKLANFELRRVNNFHPDLAAKYPEIGSFEGKSADGAQTIRFTISPWNFFASIYTTGEGYAYLEPYSHSDFDHLMFYQRVNYLPEGGWDFICGTEDVAMNHKEHPASGINAFVRSEQEKAGAAIELRTYRVAIATVGEFTSWAAIGGVPQALAKINESLDIINGIYHEEVAVNFELIANNDVICYTDPNTDPYIMVNDGGGLLNQNQTNLEATIGVGNFDIGHVFTRGCSGGLGGIAQRGSVCTNGSKARGVTCWASNTTNIVTSIMVHELGHSFDAPHSWNKCPGSDDQRAPETAYEPGSGSTIMSYAGACGALNNVQNSNDFYFNIGSLEYMYRYRNTGNGSTCGSLSDVNNQPDVEILSPGGVVIPLRTPFKLDASATDDNGDNFTFCWEQHDLGPEADLGNPIGDGPAFRSFLPVATGTRVFPKWSNVLNHSNDKTEVLATYERTYEFTVTVRDDNLPTGGVAFDTINFSASEMAGPFEVISPLATATWEAGTIATVEWDVANTDVAPVNCQSVNIVLSLGGANFNTVLAEGVPNTGSAQVLVPDVTSTGARILVEAVGNVFFEVNEGPFEIMAPTAPGLSIGFVNVDDGICLPGQLTYDIETASLSGYASPVTYDVTGLPAGATATFSPNPAMPTDALSLTIDFDANVPTATYDLNLTANGDGLTEIVRPFKISALSQDFSGLALTAPASGATGIAEVPSLSWTDLPNAAGYDVQLSANPAFISANTFEAVGTTLTNFSPSQPLMKNTLYYWRVRASNPCSEGPWSEIRVFHTINFACSPFTTENLDFQIPVAVGTYTNVFDIAQSGTINDLNVSFIDLEYQPLNTITIELESPDGTKEQLYDKNCSGGATIMNIGFDSQAPLEIACPPDDGGLYLPDGGNLDNFNGENTQGPWKLNISVDQSFFSPGTLNGWSLEVCSNFSPNNPELINNVTLEVKTGDSQSIKPDTLLSTDSDNTASELIYTLISIPTDGVIEAGGTNLTEGGTFSQGMINSNSVRYIHTGSSETTDEFIFTVTDGAGGFIGATTFLINVADDNPPLATSELDLSGIAVYPNPTADRLFVQASNYDQDRQVDVIDNQGRVLMSKVWNTGNTLIFATSDLPNGFYYLRIREENRIGTKKFTVIR